MLGKVYLVGAGPGDEELITVKGLNELRKADVVVYDYLSNPEFLNQCRKDCEIIYVGKSAGNHTLSQEAINHLLVEKAKEGHRVVRLKGGDPFVFGRGGEEGAYLKEHSIDFEVIPGITSAIGGLAYGGIPITQRGMATSFHVFTGHLKDGAEDLDWATLAKIQGTMVFLMGVGNLDHICTSLKSYGKNATTPVAIIYRASTPYQKTTTGTLETIIEIAKQKEIKAPSLIVIGEVVNMRESLNWYESKPLFGKKVIVTRARENSSKLASQLKALGAEILEYPTIRIQPIKDERLDRTIEQLEDYSYLVLTSKKGVELFFDELFTRNKDLRKLAHLKIVAIGRETAKALKRYGILADIVPDEYVAESLIDALKGQLTSSDRILIPRSKNGRSLIIEELSKICSIVDLPIYETLNENFDGLEELVQSLKEKQIDYVTFTSSSTVLNFTERVGKEHSHLLNDLKIISIGPITSEAVKAYGLEVYKEAKEHTIDGMIEVLLEEGSAGI